MYKNLTIIALALFSLNISGLKGQDRGELLTLRKGDLRVGILPDVGGRIVLLTRVGGENLLKSDKDLWHERLSERPEVGKRTEFKAYNGHIVWLGPQSQWWTQQDVHWWRCRRGAQWPPDPYLIFGTYRLLEQTDSSVVMQSPDSPITGVRLTKVVQLLSGGEVRLTVVAENIRSESVSWDLWFNTRFRGYDRCYVPLRSSDNLRLDHPGDELSEPVGYQLKNNFFTFLPDKPSAGKSQQVSKAFIYPDSAYIAGFSGSQALIIRFEHHSAEEIHPEQGLVEIYNNLKNNEESSLLELEYHAPYRELMPGGTMTATQHWQVLPYDGEKSPEAHCRFLNNLGKE